MILKWIKKYSKLLLIFFLIFISIGLLLRFNEERMEDLWGGKFFLSAFYPIIKILNIVDTQISDNFLIIFESKRIKNENIYLERELTKAINENRILKQSLDVLTSQTQMLYKYTQRNYRFIGATTLFVTSNKWSRSIIIDRGSLDGVLINQPVVNSEGLVGIVKSTAKKSSVIQVITDQNSCIGAKIQETDDRCLAFGMGKPSELSLKFEILSPEIKIGHTVITAGIQNSLYPPGIPIGQINGFRIDSRGNKYAVVKPYVNLQKISNVLIILEF